MHTAKSLKNNKIITSYFHTTKQKKNHFVFIHKTQKSFKKILACTLALITSLLEPWELGQYLKNSKKIFLSSFSI